jgi:hypothetical protein
MVCRATTKDLNRLFLDAVAHLAKNGSDAPDVTLKNFFRGSAAESRLWPDDRQVLGALPDLPLYRLLTRGRLRLLLEAMEDALRDGKSEDQHVVRRKLTLEHVLPRSLGANWPKPVGYDPAEALRLRDRMIHSIGNITLITGKLNSAQSNKSWHKKKIALRKHSTLRLNAELLDGWGDNPWDEETIRNRGQVLFELFKHTWPGPHPSD